MNTKTTDYPELRWRVKPSAIWMSTGLLSLVFIACVVAMVSLIHVIVLLLFLGLLSVLILFLAYSNWKTHRGAVFILNNEGVNYTGWKEAIRFQDLESVVPAKSKRNVSLIFSFKRPQDSPWKFNFPPHKTTALLFPLARLQGKPSAIADTVYRYFIRQPPTSNLCLPELVTVRLVTLSGKPFRCADTLVYVNATARRKNSFHLGPYPTDSDGIARITKQELEAQVSATQDSGLMDYGSIDDCYPLVEIILATPEAISRALEARTKTWTGLLKGEEKRWKSIEELRTLLRRAVNATRAISILDPVCIRDEWVKPMAKYDYSFRVQDQ
jgi:energy-coupling factor transporter transmembrane protein EcfT